MRYGSSAIGWCNVRKDEECLCAECDCDCETDDCDARCDDVRFVARFPAATNSSMRPSLSQVRSANAAFVVGSWPDKSRKFQSLVICTT
jgi:hypothetical protein